MSKSIGCPKCEWCCDDIDFHGKRCLNCDDGTLFEVLEIPPKNRGVIMELNGYRILPYDSESIWIHKENTGEGMQIKIDRHFRENM